MSAVGKLIGAVAKGTTKSVKPSTKAEESLLASRETGGGKTEGAKERIEAHFKALTTDPTPGQRKTLAATKSTRAYREGQNIAGAATAAVSLPAGVLAGAWLKENDEPPKSKAEATEFEKAFSSAHNAGEETFEFDGKMYTTDVGKGMRNKKSAGGKIIDIFERVFAKAVPEKALIKKGTTLNESYVEDLLQAELNTNPAALDDLSDEDFIELMEALPQNTRAKFGVGEAPLDDMTEIMQGMEPSEAAKNLQYFNSVEEIQDYASELNPQQTKDFLNNVSEEDYEMFGGFKNMVKQLGPRSVKNEGGALLVPVEMEMPEDTYDNIPEDEMDDVMASQKPDDVVEEDYVAYVMSEALSEDEIDYVNTMLEGDDKFSQIFDKLILSAAEFQGAGEVEGPGTGTSDDIPARLSDGEFVFTKKATDQLGADQLQTMMDDAERAYDGGLMKKAKGGNVQKDTKAPMFSETGEEEEINKQMMSSNRMPSLMSR